MYRPHLCRRTAGGTVFGLYFGTEGLIPINLSSPYHYWSAGATWARGSEVRRGGSRNLHEPAADGDPGRLGAVLGFEFCQDGADVELDRPLRDEELVGDLGVLKAAR